MLHVEIIYIVSILLLIAVTSAVCFCLLVYPEVNIKEAFKLVVTASALNKLLFTGSGYFASSYFSRNKNLSFHKALSAFLLLEVLGVSLWLVLGIYFGAKLAFKIPLIFILTLVLLLLIILFQRKKFSKQVRNIFVAFKDMGRRIPIIVPFIILNMILYVCYYFFLFRFFNFHLQVLTIIKIISVSFTIGYLSPAPAGLGFKDTGLVLLLMNAGLTVNTAILITVFDRVFVTVFWGILGSIFGYSLIKNEIRKRFKKENDSLPV